MLKETGFKYVIFSITHHSNLFRVMEMNALFDALGYSKPVRCIGSYKGECENSFLTTTEALDAVAQAPGFFKQELYSQESYLLISECNKQYAALFFQHDGRFGDAQLHPIGSLHAVPMAEAKKSDAWTYRTDTGQFYVAKKENPDRVPPPQGWPSAERIQQITLYCDVLDVQFGKPFKMEDMHEIRDFLKEQYLG